MTVTSSLARATSARLLAPGAVVLGNLFLLAQLSQWRGDWTATTPAAQSSVFLLGILAAATAAWEGGRERRTDVRSLTEVTSRPGLAAALPTWCITVACSCLGYSSVLLTAITVTAVSAPVGRLDVRVLALGYAVLAAMTSLGWLLGSIVRSVAAAPLAGIAAFAWMGLPEPLAYGSWVAGLNGLYTGTGSAAEVVRGSLLAGQSIFFLGAAVALLVGAAALASGDSVRWATSATAFAAPVVGVLVLMSNGSQRVDVLPPAAVCHGEEQVEVCVRPEHEGRLALLVSSARDVAGAVPLGPDVPRRFVEYGTGLSGTAGVPTREFVGLPRSRDEARLALSELVITSDCDDPPVTAGSDVTRRMVLAVVFADRLALPEPDVPAAAREAAEILERSPGAGSISWTAAALESLHTCGPVPEWPAW